MWIEIHLCIQEVQKGIYTEKPFPALVPSPPGPPVGRSWQFLVCLYRDIFIQANTSVDSSTSFFIFTQVLYTVLDFVFFFKSA